MNDGKQDRKFSILLKKIEEWKLLKSKHPLISGTDQELTKIVDEITKAENELYRQAWVVVLSGIQDSADLIELINIFKSLELLPYNKYARMPTPSCLSCKSLVQTINNLLDKKMGQRAKVCFEILLTYFLECKLIVPLWEVYQAALSDPENVKKIREVVKKTALPSGNIDKKGEIAPWIPKLDEGSCFLLKTDQCRRAFWEEKKKLLLAIKKRKTKN